MSGIGIVRHGLWQARDFLGLGHLTGIVTSGLPCCPFPRPDRRPVIVAGQRMSADDLAKRLAQSLQNTVTRRSQSVAIHSGQDWVVPCDLVCIHFKADADR